ncbi:MAG: radical SAM protein [Clostridiales bacterium]|nr:radical SAM protein [Clostridiales bacterium]
MTAYHLKDCVWEITLSCCFSCIHCGSRGGRARENELTTEECLDVASQLAGLGCRRVSLIGGEVFMRGDWPVIAKALTDRGIRVTIITNGYLFTENLIAQLKEAGTESVAVSVDGPETIHDKYRQKGSFQRTQEAIRNLTRHQIPVSVITTLHAENVPYLETLYRMLCGYPIFAWQLQACSPMGYARDGHVEYRFDPAEVIRFVAVHRKQAPFRVGIADNIGYYTQEEGILRGSRSGRAYFGGCGAGLSSVGIDSTGNVRGCESMYSDRFIEGNLREKSLREIWESQDAFSYNRNFLPDMLTGACASCEYGIYCAGGCRSYNYFVHGMLYESPYCARVQGNAEPIKQRRNGD